MRALIQRVTRAAVIVENRIVSRIGPGLLIFLGVSRDDTPADADFLAEKIPNLRVFDDKEGKMNISGLELGSEFLVISQFTLYADCKQGRRPAFDLAAPGPAAMPLYEDFVKKLAKKCPRVSTGIFGAAMRVDLENDGPVTLWLDTRA